MSDLIKRSDVIQILDENGWLYETDIDDLIKEIPTAYDVNKVIEELLALNKNYNDGINLYEEVAEIPTEDAIEIVKQCGVPDDADNVCKWTKIDEEGYKNCKCNYDETIPDFFKYCPYCRKKIKVVE